MNEAGYGTLDGDNDGIIDNATDNDHDGIADVIDTLLGVFGGIMDPMADRDGDLVPNGQELLDGTNPR